MASSSCHSRSLRSTAVPQTHVRLILLDGANSHFYLEISIAIINLLCLKPLKYLLFLGWCVLGIDGVLAAVDGGDEINTDEDLDAGGTYYYVTPRPRGGLFKK